jgi:hypothetical protein
MKTIIAPRASTILYDLLISIEDRRPFLLPANICPIVPLTFLKARLPFEFVDISPQSLHIDMQRVHTLLAQRKGGYAGVLYSHTYGDPTTPGELFRELKDQNPDFLIIDDRCLCAPDLEPDLSSAASVILYSTGYAKIVDLDYGGYAFLHDDCNYGHHALAYDRTQLEAVEHGYKRSMATGAAYTYVDSNWLQTDFDPPSWSEYAERVRVALKISRRQRESINSVYDAIIPAHFRLSPNYQFWRYNVLVKDKKKVLAAIFADRLFASGHYASLAGIFGAGRCPAAEELAGRVINLFNDHHYSLDMAERTGRIVRESL